jgi:hypothetical protein
MVAGQGPLTSPDLAGRQAGAARRSIRAGVAFLHDHITPQDGDADLIHYTMGASVPGSVLPSDTSISPMLATTCAGRGFRPNRPELNLSLPPSSRPACGVLTLTLLVAIDRLEVRH